MISTVLESSQLKQLPGLFISKFGFYTSEQSRQRNVFQDRQRGKQVEGLKDHSDASLSEFGQFYRVELFQIDA